MEENQAQSADRACNTCRQRRVKCDKRLPGCQRCEKLGRPCTGYDTERKFLDEGIKVRRKYDGHYQPNPDLSRHVVTSPPQHHPAFNSPPKSQRPNASSFRSSLDQSNPIIPQILSPPIDSTPQNPVNIPSTARSSLSNIQSTAYGLPNQPSPGFYSFPPTPPIPPPAPQPLQPTQHQVNVPQPNNPANFQQPHEYDNFQHPTAKLLLGKPHYAESDLDTSISEDYFDLDIDTYYAKGNNACGFIPGLPVILTDQTEPETDEDLLTNDYASLSGRSSVYDGSEGRTRPEYSQKYLHERATELACLTRHFVQAISPSMDLFDLDTYFSRIVPLKAVQNVMLRSAMAAVAANQIGQLLANHTPREGLQHLLPIMGDDGIMQHTDWFYKAANYYDRGISYLRIFLQRWLSDSSSGVTGHASKYTAPKHLSETGAKSAVNAASPHKRRRISTQEASGADMEALVAAISVFSLYESLDNPTEDWSQHLDGFKALLETKIIPQAMSTPRPRADPFISMKAGRAAFWNFARADYLAAYINRTRTRLDPDNLTMWKAAGLPVADDGTLTYSDPTTPGSAIVSYRPADREDLVSCTLIWIVLRTMNFIAPQEDAGPSTTNTPHSHDSPATRGSDAGNPSPIRARIAQWKQLRRQLEDWYDNLPFTFQPYAIMGAQNPYDQPPDHPPRFTRIFFSVPMCAAALQLYHFAQILLLLNQPMDESDTRNLANRIRMFRKVSEESEHHSRQICGIALGKPPPAVARQMVHSLYLAGLCFEEKDDRVVVLELLQNIERETGASTAQRVRELREQWGWDDEVQEVQ
ncbi:Transcription activator AMTR1 [Exophiala dermatitidis]